MNNQPNEKPKNFKEAALSHIPPELVQSMLNTTKVETAGMGYLEAIAKNTPTVSPLPIVKPEVPAQEQFISLAIDGHVIKVPSDATKGAVVMFMYILASELSKNKHIAKILKQFNFTMYDVNNNQIYPKKRK